jgi:hypothetical protein
MEKELKDLHLSNTMQVGLSGVEPVSKFDGEGREKKGQVCTVHFKRT